MAGDASVLDDRCLNGLRETYQALGVPGGSTASGVQKMKDIAINIANDAKASGIVEGDCSAFELMNRSDTPIISDLYSHATVNVVF